MCVCVCVGVCVRACICTACNVKPVCQAKVGVTCVVSESCVCVCVYVCAACLACVPADLTVPLPPVTSRLALICGTSTCHMVVKGCSFFLSDFPGARVWVRSLKLLC